MQEFYNRDIPILDESRAEDRDALFDTRQSFGLVPRDYAEYPKEMFGQKPSEMFAYERSEWDALFDEQNRTESSLEHMFLRGGRPAFTNLDQNGDGHCWAYSTVHGMMLALLRDHGVAPRLNPHFIASYLQRWNGGWCGASAKVAQEVGCPVEGTGVGEFPLHRNDARLARAAAVLTAAAKYKTAEQWRDLSKDIWNQQMSSRHLATCGFLNVPSPSDFNWWGHSVCQVRWVRIERGSWGPLILNSWKGWGRFGLAVLRGSQATADGAVAIRTAGV